MTAAAASETIVLPYNDPGRGRGAPSRPTGRTSPRSSPRRRPATWVWCRRRPASTPFLADIAHRHGALLILDEVMTGFRVARGGWAEYSARAGEPVDADLYTYGKVMGGGLPAAAFGGRAEIMAQLAPAGPVYQAGTLSGNPLACAAGLATLRECTDDVYARLDKTADAIGGPGRPRPWPRPGCRTGCRRPATCSRSSSPTTPVDDYDGRAGPRTSARVRGVLPRDAGARGLPAAVGVRGLVRLGRASTTRPWR